MREVDVEQRFADHLRGGLVGRAGDPSHVDVVPTHPDGVPALARLSAPTVAQPLDDYAPFQPSEHARHLLHSGTHRVIGVVAQHLALKREHVRVGVQPHLCKHGLLHGDLTGEPVQVAHQRPVDRADREHVERGLQAWALARGQLP